jgi:hypothetical protein
MKESERLAIKAEHEDNDLKAMGLISKSYRALKKERFQEEWLPLIQQKTAILYDEKKYCYLIDLPLEQVEFYPGKNTMFCKSTKQWKKPALHVILTELQIRKNEN